MLDPAGAVEALQRSVELDPGNLESAVRLCDVFEALRRTADRNRLLDAMVGQFPENKAVLLRAARRCVDRKAFAKGLDYLARARELDLLDPALTRETVRALFGQAGEHFKKRRLEAARAALDRALTLAVDQPSNLACARWCLLARRAAIEEAQGNPALVEALLAQARTSSPSPEALLLYAHLAALTNQRAGSYRSTRFSRELLGRHLKSASARHAVTLLRICEFWAGSADETQPAYLDGPLVREYLEAAQKTPFTDDEARHLAEHIGPDGEFLPEASGFVRRVLARDRKHPWFRLFQFLARPFGFTGAKAEVQELRGILEEANHRGDSETAQRVEQLLRRPPPAEGPFPPPPPEAWGDLDDDGTADEEGLADRLPADFGPFDPNEAGTIDGFIARLAQLSEGQLRRARESMLKKGLPGFIFDLLADAARRGGPAPHLPPMPKPPAPKPPPPDPNQIDLF
jgi:tetratricopeptide (TPR) repeat protein